VRRTRERGIALITVMLILVVVSAIVVGMSWMVMTDQRLGGNNKDRQAAFYGAEAGMEKLTADVGNIFATKGAITGGDLTTAPITVAPTIPGIQYQNALGISTYQVTCTGCPGLPPQSQNGTILPPSPYSGMSALITPFTLTVAAQTTDGAEVKLQRLIQLVAIPVFQFGIFCNDDCDFFAGPIFDFGGRIHTNGNLWLAANSGPLYLGDKVTASGQVILSNLENGYPGGGATITAGGTYGGNVDIATAPLPIPPNPSRPPWVPAQWQTLLPTQGSVNGPTVYGQVNLAAPNATWPATEAAFQGMVKNATPPLNLTSSALGGLTQPIFLIERPVVGEQAANPGQFNERYFAGGASQAGNGQVSLRILLDDYGIDGTCGTADMRLLDTVSAAPPTDLATLAFGLLPPQHYLTAPLWYTASIPLPTSNAAAGGAYSSADGYWVARGNPTIAGCIKIEYESAAGAFVDVTHEILNLGFTGANIDPLGPPTAPAVPSLPANGAAIFLGGSPCANVSGSAVIRLARMRDNPQTATALNLNCGTLNDVFPTDYWPNVLYDPREGISRDLDPSPGGVDPNNPNHNPYITAQGVMNYIELDVSNLQKWFTGAIPGSGVSASNVGGYMVYFSDRRGNQIDTTAGINLKTGSFGFNDIINGSTDPANGCPNTVMDPGEDFVGDGVMRTYGGRPLSLGPLVADDPQWLGYAGFVGTYTTTPVAPDLVPNLLQNPNCPGPPGPPGPNYVYKYSQEARENPPVFFRRALKLVNGKTINLGTACYGAAPNPPCGLTIAAENPVYVQGEYNDGGVNNGTWAGNSVAASVAGDAVTFLSNNWNDVNSFISPYSIVARPAVTTSYRTAVISGKGIPFAQPPGTGQDYGTDGGVHNFLRYIEDWGPDTLYYEGSLVSFYHSVQAIGPYKCCVTVYGPPNRQYLFDQNFTAGPQWLPPRTPTLRSINTIGFSQQILPQ
jgi:hypothetical protein